MLHPGRDAERLLSSLAINRFENFPVTKAKHFIPTSYDGDVPSAKESGVQVSSAPFLKALVTLRDTRGNTLRRHESGSYERASSGGEP